MDGHRFPWQSQPTAQAPPLRFGLGWRGSCDLSAFWLQKDSLMLDIQRLTIEVGEERSSIRQGLMFLVTKIVLAQVWWDRVGVLDNVS